MVLRCRPLFPREKEDGATSLVSCSSKDVTVRPVFKWSKVKKFTFDHVFGPQATQRTLYEQSILPAVMRALEGFNCTVFAYGQTGTGKTYTMEGAMAADPKGEGHFDILTKGATVEEAGIIPRAVHTVFEALTTTTTDHTVEVSHLEIYNEELTDLLAPDHEAVAQRLIRRRRSFTTSRALVEAAKKRGVEMTFMGPAQAAALAQSASESNLPGTPHHHHHHGGFPGSAPSTPKKFPGTKRLRIIQTRAQLGEHARARRP